MNDHPKRNRKKPVRSTDYEIGYSKPPVATRFQPGQSGNPRGRPKGATKKSSSLTRERLKDIILEEAYREITVNDVTGPIKMPMVQAIIRSMSVNAAKGNQRSQRQFTQMLALTEREDKRLQDEYLAAAIEYKTGWEIELARRARQGISAPPPVPHPDDIVIDMQTGSVHINGPLTKEEIAEWPSAAGEKKTERPSSNLAQLKAILTPEPSPSRQPGRQRRQKLWELYTSLTQISV